MELNAKQIRDQLEDDELMFLRKIYMKHGMERFYYADCKKEFGYTKVSVNRFNTKLGLIKIHDDNLDSQFKENITEILFP